MTEEEKKELKSLIEEYEICYKESEYEGNVEDYKELKDTHKVLNNALNYIEKLQKEVEDFKNYEQFKAFVKEVDDLKKTLSELNEENEELKEHNNKLANKLKKSEGDIKSLNIENQALYESINCNDDNMLAIQYKKLKEKIKEYEIGKEQE